MKSEIHRRRLGTYRPIMATEEQNTNGDIYVLLCTSIIFRKKFCFCQNFWFLQFNQCVHILSPQIVDNPYIDSLYLYLIDFKFLK